VRIKVFLLSTQGNVFVTAKKDSVESTVVLLINANMAQITNNVIIRDLLRELLIRIIASVNVLPDSLDKGVMMKQSV